MLTFGSLSASSHTSWASVIARVKLECGSYEGEVVVTNVNPDDEDDTICARAWEIAKRRGWLPSGIYYQRATVIERAES